MNFRQPLWKLQCQSTIREQQAEISNLYVTHELKQKFIEKNSFNINHFLTTSLVFKLLNIIKGQRKTLFKHNLDWLNNIVLHFIPDNNFPELWIVFYIK